MILLHATSETMSINSHSNVKTDTLSPNSARIKPAKHFMPSSMQMSLLATLHHAMFDTILPHATYETKSMNLSTLLKPIRILQTVRECKLTSTSSPASCKTSLSATLYKMTRHSRHNIVEATPKILATSRYCNLQPYSTLFLQAESEHRNLHSSTSPSLRNHPMTRYQLRSHL